MAGNGTCAKSAADFADPTRFWNELSRRDGRMTLITHNPSDHIDDPVDNEIDSCLSLDSPTSFFLFAGAGSGKTRSLVRALGQLRQKAGRRLELRGQQIA